MVKKKTIRNWNKYILPACARACVNFAAKGAGFDLMVRIATAIDSPKVSATPAIGPAPLVTILLLILVVAVLLLVSMPLLLIVVSPCAAPATITKSTSTPSPINCRLLYLGSKSLCLNRPVLVLLLALICSIRTDQVGTPTRRAISFRV